VATDPSLDPTQLRFGPFEFDQQTCELKKRGRQIRLRPQAVRVLAILVARAGQVVTREELKAEIWGSETFVDFENGLNLCIRQIRATLDDDAVMPRYIETHSRRGYRFIGSVAHPAAGFSSETELKRLERDTESGGIAPPTSLASHNTGLRRTKIFVLGIVVAVLVGTVLYFAFPRGRVIDSIAVVPLVNTASDPNSDYLSEGITDGLIDSLSQLPNLTVKSERSVARYKGRDIDPRVVGSELGVRAVLVGKLVPHRDSISISVELVDARNDNHIWGNEYDRKMADVAGIQEMISKDIAEKLRPKLSGEQKAYIAKPQTQNAEAYALYLKGRFYWRKRTEDGLREGLACFEQARQIDPNYALAYAGVADSYNMLGIWQFVAPHEAAPKARAAALKALELDPLLPEAHASLGMVKTLYEWDWAGGENEIKEALRLNPSYETAYRWYATILDGTERHEEVIASSRHALELDPTSLINSSSLGFELYMVGKYDDAVAHLQNTLAMDPNYFPAHHWLSMTYIEKAMPNDALQEARKAANLSNQSTLSMSDLARSYAVSGNAKEARRILQSLQAVSKSRYVSSFEVATIFATLNESDHAFDSLQKACEDRDYNLFRLRADPRLQSLDNDPRYADLLRRIGLPR
jgi:TolB-like protein/DNA-binding winged helix-turn-helix (wHTH) protein/Tfp pilus assembly protein PilF